MSAAPLARRALLALAVVIAVGAVLRLLWLGDMEYKADEADMFLRSQAGELPAEGLVSGAGLRNPGMSVWVFVALAEAFGIDGPVGLARAVAVSGVVALVALALFAWRMVPAREREPWLWAVALLAVNPLWIVWERKIWAQSLLPLLSLAFLAGWWRRDTRLGAFAWGLVGAVLGQVHMSGFFLAAGFAAWTAVLRRADVRWGWWLAGSVAGALPMIGWLSYVAGADEDSVRSLKSIARLDFWRYWVTDVVGTDVRSAFGPRYGEWLSGPHVGGTPTFLVGALTVAAVALAVAVGVLAVRRLWPARAALRDRAWWRRWIAGGGTTTGLAVTAALLGFGGLLTLSGTIVYPHYLLVAFALPFVSFAAAALLSGGTGRLLLGALCTVQALLALAFVLYVHDNGGIADGGYGVGYEHQTPAQRPVVPAP